jgi:hypothetical protein
MCFLKNIFKIFRTGWTRPKKKLGWDQPKIKCNLSYIGLDSAQLRGLADDPTWTGYYAHAQ